MRKSKTLPQSRHTTTALISSVVLTAMLALCACTQQEAKQQGQKPKGYETLTVSAASRELYQQYSATIKGKQDVAIMPQVAGTITRTCVTEGQRVARGQVLFIIDQVPFLAAVRTAKANVQAATAGLATAKLDYESKQELYKQHVISEFTLQTSQNTLSSAQAALAQAQAALTNAENSLSYTRVKAPSAGIVGQLPYRTGSLVSPQMPEPLTTVSDNSEMWVYFSLTEEQLLNLSHSYGTLNIAASSMPPVQLQLKDGSTFSDPGRITSISGVVDQHTGTVTCKAVFPNRAGLLHSGQSGNIIIPHSYDNVIVIPQSAAVRQQDKYMVYKVVNKKAQAQLVTVEPINDGQELMVVDGLSVGDVIVAKGAGLLRDGMDI